MTAKEAYSVIERETEGKSIIACIDMNDFFAFDVREKGTEKELVGGGYYTVNKKTGEIGAFNPVQDLHAYISAKRIKISTLK